MARLPYNFVAGALAADAVELGEEDGRTVGTSLIPTLDSSTNGTSNDGQNQAPGHAPLVLDLVSECLSFGLVEGLGAGNIVTIVLGALGNEGTPAQDRNMLLETLRHGETLDIAHQLVVGNALQGVLNSASPQISAFNSWVPRAENRETRSFQCLATGLGRRPAHLPARRLGPEIIVPGRIKRSSGNSVHADGGGNSILPGLKVSVKVGIVLDDIHVSTRRVIGRDRDTVSLG